MKAIVNAGRKKSFHSLRYYFSNKFDLITVQLYLNCMRECLSRSLWIKFELKKIDPVSFLLECIAQKRMKLFFKKKRQEVEVIEEEKKISADICVIDDPFMYMYGCTLAIRSDWYNCDQHTNHVAISFQPVFFLFSFQLPTIFNVFFLFCSHVYVRTFCTGKYL